MARKNLTDRTLAAVKPGDPDLMDATVEGLGVRPFASGRHSFIFVARFPGSRNPTRRAIGGYRVVAGKLAGMSLSDARAKAKVWRGLIEEGVDPKDHERRQQEQRARQRENTVGAVFEEFVKEKLSKERKGAEVARDLRRDLLPALGRRPITEVTEDDVLDIIQKKKRTAPAQARNLLGYIKRFFSWAKAQRVYDLKSSPCAELKASAILGRKTGGDRTLTDDELFALWQVTERLEYPYRQAYQLLLLTALRLNEVVDATEPEFDFRPDERVWTIPASRMKGKNGEAREHVVPLIGDMLEIVGTLPNLSKGSYLFSTSNGKTPIWIGSKIKSRIDREMLQVLRDLAQKRGRDPADVELEPWVNHDIRRTVRTRLAAIEVSDEVAEAVLAHAQAGIKGTYNRYKYVKQKREALERWANKLGEIVGHGDTQPSAPVISLAARRSARK